MKIFILFLICLLSLPVFSQPPNNTIDTAIPINIPIGGTCNGGSNFTLAWDSNGTTSNLFTECFYDIGFPIYSETDQFFTWTATSLVLRTTGVPMTIYDENYNQITCFSNNNSVYNNEYADISGWAIGDIIIIQIWTVNPPGYNGDVSFCLLQLPESPPNDTITGAIPIIPSPTTSNSDCDTPTFNLPISIDGTTNSGLGDCGSGKDQFFTWTATSTYLI